MVQLQVLTGARAGELTQMRPCDMDLPTGPATAGQAGRSDDARLPDGEVWVYQPHSHKTAHHGFPQTCCFCPAEVMEEWRRQAFENRTAPLSRGNSPGTNRKENPKWTAGDRYTTDTYRIAIVRACD
jgi:hypothetical protein